MSKSIDEHIQEMFQIKKLLGSGAYGHVWHVKERSTQKQFALKKVFDAFQNPVDSQRTYRQITILHELDHENIIKLASVIKSKSNKDLYLLFDYMEADLHSLIGRDILETSHIKFVIYQMCKVLKYLHSAQLIHRDLKSSNILINSFCEIKLCDFGLVRSLTHEEDSPIVLSEDVATRWYRSPEMLMCSASYGKPTDMWSIGCIIGELVTGQPLFTGTSTLNQIEKVLEFTGIPSQENIDALDSEIAGNLINQIKIKKRSLKSYFKQCDNELLQILMRMLQFNPTKRITAQEALQLPCLQQFRSKNSEIICQKFIIPELDDNVRLTVDEYRNMIYKDIERRYPQHNPTSIPFYRYLRSHHSLKAKPDQQDGARRLVSNSLMNLTRKKEQKRQLQKTYAPNNYSPIKEHASLHETINDITRIYRKQKHRFGHLKENSYEWDQQKIKIQKSTKLVRKTLNRRQEWNKVYNRVE